MKWLKVLLKTITTIALDKHYNDPQKFWGEILTKWINMSTVVICFVFLHLLFGLDSLDFDNWAIVNKSKVSSKKINKKRK